MIIYGTDLCKDCVQCKQDLDVAKISYEYRDITKNLLYMKEFLSIRDSNDLFSPVREEGYIGIPAIVLEDNCVTLDWSAFCK